MTNLFGSNRFSTVSMNYLPKEPVPPVIKSDLLLTIKPIPPFAAPEGEEDMDMGAAGGGATGGTPPPPAAGGGGDDVAMEPDEDEPEDEPEAYSEIELGYPSSNDVLIYLFAEETGKPTETHFVYPSSLKNNAINKG